MPDETETRPADRDLYEEWVSSILQRSPEAWEELVAAYAPRLRQDIRISLNKWGLPPEFSEDIEQETWLRALRSIEKFVWEDDEKFYHYLRSISSKCIYELRRSANRTASLEDLVEDDSDEELDRLLVRRGLLGETVENQVILHDFAAALDRALRTLRPREREIFVRWLAGDRPRMLATTYGMKAASVSRLLYRASKRVEAYLVHIDPINLKDNHHE